MQEWIEAHRFTVPVPASWPEGVPDDWPAPESSHGMAFWSSRSIAYSARGVERRPLQAGDVWHYQYGQSEIGWPFRAFSLALFQRWDFTPGLGVQLGVIPEPGIAGFLNRGLLIERPPAGPRNDLRLPIRPAFPGFVFNVLFYAGAAWGTLAALRASRGVCRRRRGRCPGCAYEIRDQVRCPECGRVM